MVTALSLLEQGFRNLTSPIAFVRAGGFFENFLYGLQVAQGGTLPVYYNPTNRKSTMVATNDIGAQVATLLTGPAWSGQRTIELGSMVTADEVAEQLGEVLNRDVKAFAVPRAGWAKAFEQFGIPKGHTGPAEEMYDGINEGWMGLGIAGRFHNYSFGNILEIARQKPDATRVAGLYAWNQFGRKVKKGEHGIRTLRPYHWHTGNY